MVEWFCIIGLFQHKISFIYGLAIGGVKRKPYIQMIEPEADKAQQAGRLTIVVQDNSPINTFRLKVNGFRERGKSSDSLPLTLPLFPLT